MIYSIVEVGLWSKPFNAIECWGLKKKDLLVLNSWQCRGSRFGLKTGVENDIFWSDIGSGFGELGCTHLPRIPRSTLPPWSNFPSTLLAN